jgi:hypothetical protein
VMVCMLRLVETWMEMHSLRAYFMSYGMLDEWDFLTISVAGWERMPQSDLQPP